MKKCLILFLCIFTTESFASGIASNSASAPCTNNTLETYSGNSNLSADWQPNEIQLRWYNGNTLMDVQTSANTCVYDGALTIPQNAPTRTGYTFAGWEVRPQMDFSTLSTTNAGEENWTIGVVDNRVRCRYNENSTDCNSADFKDLGTNEWVVRYSWGKIYGMAICRNNIGDWARTGIPGNTDGKYCWCRVTGYMPATNNQDNTIYSPDTAVGWVFTNDDGSLSGCLGYCAQHCANGATIYYTSFLPSMFGVGQ